MFSLICNAENSYKIQLCAVLVSCPDYFLYLKGLSKFFLFLFKPLFGFLQFMCREATLAQLTLKVTHFLCRDNRGE